MTDLLAARSQMAMSLAFHILFAVAGIGMPLLMMMAEGAYLRTKQPIYLDLAKRWAKGTAILFVVGAVSGTVLSFELGLLWPRFMAFAGPIIGMPFSLEGFAFFTEAIFLGIYLYGWNRISNALHFTAGVLVFVSGAASSLFVVCANAFMNTPQGFTLENGQVTAIDPIAAMLNPGVYTQCTHMTLAALVVVGFAVASIHAVMLLKTRGSLFHQKAFVLALGLGFAIVPLMWLTGDRSAKHVGKYQPIKLAAMEGQWDTQQGAPLRLFGWPDATTQTTPYAIEIPYMLSFLAYGNKDATVLGLKSFPKDDLPPIWPVHVSFQLMVGTACWMSLVMLLALYLKIKKRILTDTRWFLAAVVPCGPLAFVALEAGWVVTEVGRQPWIIYNVMRTKDAVTSMPQLIVPFLVFSALYCFLGIVVILLLKQQVFLTQSPPNKEQP